MEKNWSMGPTQPEPIPDSKKIQNYIYRFSDQIGQGNFSKVYKGVNQLTSSKRVQQLLNTETKILKMINHKNIIQCEQILSSANNCYIITELCDGDLQKKVKKSNHLKQKDIYPIALDIFEGLKYLNKKHIIHRDLKISNIFIRDGVYKIADFGFAQISQKQFKDISVGSPLYMSPQGYIDNIYGPKSDFWAFGVLLFQLIQGRTPCSNCRTQSQLRTSLSLPLLTTSFTHESSSQFQQLVLGLLKIDVNNRWGVQQIQNCAWMIKAKKQRRQSEISGNKSFRDSLDIGGISVPLNTKITFLKNYQTKTKQQQQQQRDLRKKHQTLDKGTMKMSMNQNQITGNKMFYSPKNNNTRNNFDSILNKLTNQSRFQTVHFQNLSSFQSPIRPIQSLLSPNQNNFQRRQSWLQRSQNVQRRKSKMQFNGVQSMNISKPTSNYNSGTTTPAIGAASTSISQQLSRLRQRREIYNSQLNSTKFQSKIFNNDSKIFNQSKFLDDNKRSSFNCTDLSNRIQSRNNNQSNMKSSSNKRDQDKSKYYKIFTQLSQPQTTSQFLSVTNNSKKSQNRTSTMFNSPITGAIQSKSTNIVSQLKPLTNSQPSTKPASISGSGMRQSRDCRQQKKVITRMIKFSDSIGIIHYCRLCYKFAQLLNQHQNSQYRNFLINWAIQILTQISVRVDNNGISYVQQSQLSQYQRKRKLKDVTSEYLGKYQKHVNPKTNNNFKQASSQIYNIYLNKGHTFRELALKDNKGLYSALLCYLSTLDRQTRNLMEFLYQIKNNFDGRMIQKLLAIRISDFTNKTVQQIIGQRDY